MKLTTAEIKFMNLVWKYEPIISTQLVKICNDEFEWKKSTTYTFIKRLQEKGIVVNENTYVKSVVSKEEYQKSASIDIVDTVYDGSLTKFLISYLNEKNISMNECNEIICLVESKSKAKKTVFQFDID